MARYKAVLTVKLDGITVATDSGDPGSESWLAVDDLSVTWGRDNEFSHQDEAQATLTVWDRTNDYLTRVAVPYGQLIELFYTPVRLDAAGNPDGAVFTSRRFFYGRVVESLTIARPPDPVTGNTRGPLQKLTCASILSELATVRVAVSAWGQESMLFRWAKIADALRSQTTLTVPSWPLSSTPTLQPQDNGSGILEPLKAARELADQWPLFILYDPDAHALRFGYRRHWSAVAGGRVAMVMTPPGGEIGAKAAFEAQWVTGVNQDGPLGTPVSPLPLQEFTGDPTLSSYLDRNINGTDLTYPGGASYASITERYGTGVAGQPQRRMTLNTDMILNTDARASRDRWTALMQQEGDNQVPAEMTHLTELVGDSFPHWDAMNLLLAGREFDQPVYLHGHSLTANGWVPIVAIIGGVIRYANGHWSPTVRFGACSWVGGSQSTAAPVTFATCDPGGTLKISDLDPSVTVADCLHWTAAFGVRPAPVP